MSRLFLLLKKMNRQKSVINFLVGIILIAMSTYIWGFDSNTIGKNSPEIVRFSIHEHHKSYLKDSHLNYEKGILRKILDRISKDSGVIFEPLWRTGTSSGEHELAAGKVEFIIDPPSSLIKNTPQTLLGPSFFKGHAAVIKRHGYLIKEPNKLSNTQRIAYLSGITDYNDFDYDSASHEWIAINSFSDLYQAFSKNKIDQAIIPLRLAQHHILGGLESELFIDRLYTHEPFSYQWIFSSKQADLKVQIDEIVKNWSYKDLKSMIGLNVSYVSPPFTFGLNDEWIYIGLSIFLLFILAMITWIWTLRKNNLQTLKRENMLYQSEKQAILESTAKSNFLATVSHEIRTPMHAVLGVQELLLQSDSLPQEEKSLLMSAQYAANSLLEILNQVLDISKIEAGKFKLNIQAINLRHLLENSIKPFSSLIDLEKVTCKITIDPCLAESLLIDAGRLRQILQNLLSNSVKYTHSGSIHLSCQILNDTYAEQLIRINIADTGVGMAENEIQRLLQPFEQSENQQSSLIPGTGLGLSITSNLLKLMSSQLIIHSHIGLGTTASFTLNLPRSSAKALCLEDKASWDQNSSIHIHKKLTALIVDDYPASLTLLQLQISKLGFKTLTADSPDTAIGIAKNNHIDLLITDQSMPKMSGCELSVIFKKIHPDAYIIGLTADIFAKENNAIYLDSGMNRLLVKPINLQELQNCINGLFMNNDLPKSDVSWDLDTLRSFSGDDIQTQCSILKSVLSVQQEAIIELSSNCFDENHARLKSLVHKIRGGAQLSKSINVIQACITIESTQSTSDKLISSLIKALEQNNKELSAFINRI